MTPVSKIRYEYEATLLSSPRGSIGVKQLALCSHESHLSSKSLGVSIQLVVVEICPIK